ncbi:MAG: DUF1109 family protein [Alphaproteobacteria bacterium]|nr:MAG: DUF1109 family protein [Alphaproteobacteria bacterium]
MPIEQLRSDPFLDALAADLEAVTPRRPVLEAALIAALIAVELLLFVALGEMRPDMPHVMLTLGFWWKSGYHHANSTKQLAKLWTWCLSNMDGAIGCKTKNSKAQS